MPVQSLSENSIAGKGKKLFQAKCASCHNLLKDGTGPALLGYETRSDLSKSENFLAWLQNPSLYMKKDKYTSDLFKRFNAMMVGFPNMTREEADLIAAYLQAN